MPYEMVNPVREAISTYRDVNDIFRQDRAEQRAVEDREYNRGRQTTQDAMAKESHDLDIKTKNVALAEIEKKKLLDSLQAAKYKVDNDLPLDDSDFSALEKDTSLAPYLKDMNKRAAYVKAAQDLHADIPDAIGMNGPPNKEAYQRVLNNLTVVAENRLTQYGSRPGRIVGITPAPGGKFFIEGEFERQTSDGKTEKYIAPLTKNQSSDPNDVVNAYTINEVLPKITDNADLLEKIGKVIDARRIAAGDDEPLKTALQTKKSKALAKALKESADGDEFSDKQLGIGVAVLDNGGTIKEAVDTMKSMKKEKKEKVNAQEVGTGTPGETVTVDLQYDSEGNPVAVPIKGVKPKKAKEPKDTEGASERKAELKDAFARRKTALDKYNRVKAQVGQEADNGFGVTKKITTGDLEILKEELDAANQDVVSSGGRSLTMPKQKKIILNPNAKQLRTAYEGASDKAHLEQSARRQGYSEDDIRYMKGELDNKDVKVVIPQSAAKKQASASDVQAAIKGAKTRQEAISRLKAKGFTHDEAGRSL